MACRSAGWLECSGCLGVLTFVAVASGAVVSRFETSAEGWTSVNNSSGAAGDVVWIAPSETESGYIQLTDATQGWAYFRAPSSFLIDGYGGNFSFDLKHAAIGQPVQRNVRVAIVGGGLTLINESVLPTADWSRYSFYLGTGVGWRVFSDVSQVYTTSAPLASDAQMRAAAGGMTGLYIAADYTPGTLPDSIDRTWIDNVVLKACPGDLDDGSGTGTPDGSLDINDLLFFLVWFEEGSGIVDLDNDGDPAVGNPDGGVDINDLLYFLARFEAGC